MAIKGNARDWQTRLRLWAAFLMAFYFSARLGYYAMGLISTEAMEAYLNFLGPLWILSPFFGAVVILHALLGLWKLYRRNTLKMPLWELAQIAFGMAMPYFLFPYIITTNIMGPVFGIELNYVDSILLTYPAVAWSFISMALVMGVHGNIGAHVVLRMRPWYPRIRWVFAAVLASIPLSAALGYLRGGQTLYQALVTHSLAADDMPHALSAAQLDFIAAGHFWTYISVTILYAMVLGARAIRMALMNSLKTVVVSYPNGAKVSVIPGTTVLEASRIGGIPHASICGGRARCTTCRVKVESGMENLSEIGKREFKALKRIGAGREVRLACQAQCLKPDITIVPLLPAEIKSKKARQENQDSVGRDVELTVMFADLRGFTSLSEGKFPYDIVYILNSYFENMGKAIESNGGRIDKFLGDGILAYFGLDHDAQTGARDAMAAAVAMSRQLDEVNLRLKDVLESPLSIGIGLHFGDVILGEIGYKDKSSLTIIGDAVNTASRLQSMTKQAQGQMLLSTAVAAKAGLDLSFLPMAKVAVRGKTEAIRVYLIKDILGNLAPVLGTKG